MVHAILAYLICMGILAAGGYLLYPMMSFFPISITFVAMGITVFFVSLFILDRNRKSFGKSYPINVSFSTIVGVYIALSVAMTYLVEFQLTSFSPLTNDIVVMLFDFDLTASFRKTYLIAHAILFAIMLLILLILHRSYQHFQGLTKETDANVTDIRLMVADLNDLIRQAGDIPGDSRTAVVKRLEALRDSVRYCDPMTHPSLADTDYAVKNGIFELGNYLPELQSGADISGFQQMATYVERMLQTRNEKLRILKH